MDDDRWIFGYGSLIWRPAFRHEECRPAYVRGFERRFWQRSVDHRGTPERPGRVVTLVREPGAICWGVAYRVTSAEYAELMADLDWRERGGYERVETDVHLQKGGEEETAPAVVYVATPANRNYVGPSPLEDVAAIVREAVGPTGPNDEYVLRLAEALEDMGVEDPHVAELARLVKES